MSEIKTIKELDSFANEKLGEILRVIDGMSFDGEAPIRHFRLSSYIKSAIHSFPREPKPKSAEEICISIGKERDRRIDGGFMFNGRMLQSRPSDRENIMGAAQLAMAYLDAGGDPKSLRWAVPENDFQWIGSDNTAESMTAVDVVAMFQAGVAFKSALTLYARAMKDAVIAAEDPLSVDWKTGWPS